MNLYDYFTVERVLRPNYGFRGNCTTARDLKDQTLNASSAKDRQPPRTINIFRSSSYPHGTM